MENRSLLIAALTFFSLQTGAFAAGPSALIVNHGKIWRVSDSGTAQALPLEFEGGENVSHLGTTFPVPAPNQKWVAFTKANDLWIYNPETNTSFKATKHGKPSDNAYTSVYALITSWSFDSRKILYYVDHSDPIDPEGVNETLEIRPAAYGYRVYDLDRKTSEPVKFPGDFEAWLPNGDFLLTSSEADILDHHLLRYRPGDDLPQLFSPSRGEWGQSSIRSNGFAIMLSLSERDQAVSPDDENHAKSRIVKINLKTNVQTDVSPRGDWSEYQSPKFSPTDRRIAYVRQKEADESGFIKGALYVDGRELAPFSMPPFDYQWITDDAIVMIQDTGFQVINAATGKEVNRINFENAPSNLTAGQ